MAFEEIKYNQNIDPFLEADISYRNFLIEELVNINCPPVPSWGPEIKKITKERKKVNDYYFGEAISLQAKLDVPIENQVNGQIFWLKLNQFCHLPKTGHDQEIRHSFGTIQALAAGLNKSFYYGQPMVEIHATACPSYLNSDDWNTVGKETGIYVYQSLNWQKLHQLVNFNHVFSHDFIKGIYLHTPLPEDLSGNCDFPGCFGIFQKGWEGKASLYTHRKLMGQIVEYLPGVTLCPDYSYVSQFINKETAVKLTEVPAVAEAWNKFKHSEYIDSAYAKWGANVSDVFSAFYLGSILAYGNHESALDISNNQPVKLYLNLEEGQSPYTFAGQSVGTDFRHLLADQGYHLALLVGKPWIVTPWAGK